MNYQQAVNYIESLAPSLKEPSLERISAFLSQHGSPENSFASLHIGGTNGKGSTVAILDSVLRCSKQKVARYTGPHLLRWNERFHINGSPIEDTEFARYVDRLKLLSERFGESAPHFGCLTWFEFITALAFFFFAENQVDIGVIEVGLGGRFDATNVLAKPLATGITNVSLDHTHILGETVEKIAFEKAGIIKRHVPVVTAATEPGLGIIKRRADELDSRLIHCREDTITASLNSALLGVHQRMNAQVAVQILQNACLLEDNFAKSGNGNHLKCVFAQDLKQGLSAVYWPGRFQILKNNGVILDGAHNLAGAQALRVSLDELFPQQTFRFIFACYENKNAIPMLTALLRSGDSLYVSEVLSNRSTFAKTALAECASNLGIQVSTYESIENAFKSALFQRKESEYVVATGSFATIKEIVSALGWSSVEDGQQIS